MKQCDQCSETKSESEFPKTGRKCKSCKAANLRNYRRNNKEHVQNRRKIWRKTNVDKVNEQKRESYRRNSDEIKKRNKLYYHQNAEYCRERQRNYQIDKETADMESWLSKCMKHSKKSDKTYNRKFDLDLGFLVQLYERQDGLCSLSGLELTHRRDDLFAASIDRIDSKCGHIKSNVQLVCSGLNRAKREYSNQCVLDFVRAIKSQNYPFLNFDGFSYPESTIDYSCHKKEQFLHLKLKPLFDRAFVPPTFSENDLRKDWDRIKEYGLKDYTTIKGWRSHKPENKPWAGKKLIWNFHPHLWDVRTQSKPIMSEVWGENCAIYDRTLKNLVEGKTKISLERIIREFVFAGVGVPSQIHAGFAKAVYEHFGCRPGDNVYDPFAGWGGRLLAAASLGLRYEACELSKPTWSGLHKIAKFIKYDNYHVDHIDSLEFKANGATFMFTSPPFGTEEYLDSDHEVDLGRLLDVTSDIPLRVLHVNRILLDRLNPNDIIPVNAKSSVGNRSSDEFLAVF